MEERIIYKTDEVESPEELRGLGFKGSMYVEVRALKDGDFLVSPEASFAEGVDAIGLLPTSRIIRDKVGAIKFADELLENMINWHCSD